MTRTTLTAVQNYTPEVFTLSYDGITSLAINGGSGVNTLVGPNATTTWSIYSANAGTLSSSNGAATFSGFQNLTGGAADNSFVFAAGAMVSGSISGGGGNNTLDTSAYTINEFFRITGANAGSATVAPTFTSIQNLIGGGAATTFGFSDGGSLAGTVNGTVNGGSGTATLDYSTGWSGTVVVDLQIGLATAVAGGVSNILNVIGASGPQGAYNLLIGNGVNTLSGGFGRRNILVAGGRASTLVGGNSDDLLIGGTTLYDAEAGLLSWQAMAAYWTGTDDFSTRVSNLLTGNGVPLLDATTVNGNGGGNTIIGNSEQALIYTDGLDAVFAPFDPNSQTVPIAP